MSIFIRILIIAIALVAGIADAQQPKKIPRIGFLSTSSPSSASFRTEPFRQGLRELGYVEGKSIVIEYRYAERKLDRLPALAAELVRIKVDIIVTAGPGGTRAAKDATNTIPIIFAFDNDPVGNGFVATLARPGGNITGLSNIATEISGKGLELLKDVVPKLSRVAVLGFATNPGNAPALKETELAARTFGVRIQSLAIRSREDIEGAFRAANKGRADAVLVLNSPPFIETRIVEFAAKARLPAVYFNTAIVGEGGLMSYGASLGDLDRRAATYVNKILKGAKPADLPVEQPTKFELVINLKTAQEIGLTIPPNVLARADKVIR
jgi:putative tryptophan/tyrosine transport system substrate-binding protein